MLGLRIGVIGRGLARHPWHVALSIAVLTLGLTCFIATGLFLAYLDGFDRELPNSERIYAVYQSFDQRNNGLDYPLGVRTAFPVAEQLRLEIPELEATARLVGSSAVVSADGGEPLPDPVLFVDADFTKIFQLDVVAGELEGALAAPKSAVLAAATATKLFGTTAAVGRVVRINRQGQGVELTVTAVVEPPRHSHRGDSRFSAAFGVLGSWDLQDATLNDTLRTSWLLPGPSTYVLLPPAMTAREFNDRLRVFADRSLPEAGAKIGFEARHVSQLVKDGVEASLRGITGHNLPLPAVLLALGGLILGVACVNFVNLTTARSAGRAREIGVRKSLGANVRAIVLQDLLQTAALTLIATALSFAVIFLATLPFGAESRALVGVPWSAPSFWLELGLLLAAVTAAAGLYPALVLARVNPSAALRRGTGKGGPRLLRTVLVGVQFGSAALLCIAVAVAYLQTSALRAKALGRFADQYVVVGANVRSASGISFDALATELLRGPGIKGVAGVGFYPWAAGPPLRVSRSPGEDGVQALIHHRNVTHDYFALLDTPLLAGRVFSRERADDARPRPGEDARGRATPPAVVLDRRAAAALGWPNPADAVGEVVYSVNFGGAPVQVVGVVESEPLTLRSYDSDAFVYALDTLTTLVTLVRIDNTQVRAALAHIDDLWRRAAPNTRIAHPFLDEEFERTYAAFTTAHRVALGLASFAIAIAAVGLLGLAGFMTARRTREIGLRKSQGATTRSILRLLLWDFSKPVVIANIVVWPIAFSAAREYLAMFVEGMPLTPLPFVLTLAATVLVAWCAMGVYVLGAARLNPAIALRHE
jgi:putative ABC transport system permease protein